MSDTATVLTILMKISTFRKNMESNTITLNGRDITCFKDGSIEKANKLSGRKKRSMGGRNNYGYMVTAIEGNCRKVHRLIAQAFLPDWNDGLQVDHIDGNKENNRIENLRMATQRQNMRGFLTKRKNTSSRYRGVYLCTRDKKWVATIRGKALGRFDSEIEAAKAYDENALLCGFLKESLNFSCIACEGAPQFKTSSFDSEDDSFDF
jgi:hypothetical protein